MTRLTSKLSSALRQSPSRPAVKPHHQPPHGHTPQSIETVTVTGTSIRGAAVVGSL